MKKQENSKIQKIKEIPKGFSFELYYQSKKIFLVIIPELGLFLSDYDYDAIELSNLGKTLRDKLMNQKILFIRKHENDRIIEIETQQFVVFFEFFRSGNIILTDKLTKKIIIAKEMRSWRHRVIKPNHEYKYPPPSKFDPAKARDNELKILTNVNEKLKSEYEKILQQYKSKDQNAANEKYQKIKESRLLKLKELTQEMSLLRGYVDNIYLKYPDYESKLEEVKNRHKHGIVNIFDVPLDVKKSLNQNLQNIFDRIKYIKKKIDGISKSIELIETKKPKAKPESNENKKTIKEWYEGFRWFVSSDNFLVVGGKDARSNEHLIRKNMKVNELIFHTDITGSPFVLIKNPDNKTIPEKTIEEAAQFCASFSKAWKIGMSIADVYYISPDQIKKEGGLPTGSFMIYGKRNWIRRITLELTIGISDKGVIYGPKNSVLKKTKNYFSVVPSEENFIVPPEFKEFENDILRIIPYGKARMRKP